MKIWNIARDVEHPHKKHLANQVIQWSRYEKRALLVLLLACFAVYGAVVCALLTGWLK